MTGIERLRELAESVNHGWMVVISPMHVKEIADQIEREHAQTVEDHERQQQIIRDLQRERDEALRDLKKSRESAESSIIQKEVIGTCEVFEELHEGGSCFEELTKVLDEFHRLIEAQGEALRAAAASRRVASELRTLAGAWDEWGLGGTLDGLADRLEARDVTTK